MSLAAALGLARQAAKAAAPQQPAPDHVDGAISFCLIFSATRASSTSSWKTSRRTTDEQVGAAGAHAARPIPATRSSAYVDWYP